MTTVVGIVVFAGLVFAVYALQRAVGRGSAAIAGAVTGNTCTRGVAAMRLGLRFELPVSGAELVNRLVSPLDVNQAQLTDGLKVVHVAADGSDLVLAIGGRSGKTAKFHVSTEAAGSGSRGEGTVTAWREVDGRMPAADAVERIHEHLRSAVSGLGGTLSEFESR